MVSQSVTVTNPTGLHARPASLFVTEAKKYASKLTVKKGEKTVNGKSIIALMSAGISAGTEIDLILDGDDEETALAALVALIRAGFGEKQEA